MKNRVVFWTLTVIFLGSFLRASTSQKQNPDFEALALKLAKEHNIPGLVLAFGEPGGKIEMAWTGLEDIAKKTPVSRETRFFIGSISKNIGAVLIFLLQEEGRLFLNDPISKFVDWPRGDEVTIRMLLNHTSGIPDYIAEVFSRPQKEIDRFFRKKIIPDEAIAIVRTKPYGFEPGTKQEYSNTGAVLAGMIAAQASGKKLAKLLKERIFEPVGMKDSYLYGKDTKTHRRARSYQAPRIWKEPLIGGLFDCTFADEAIVDAADGTIVCTARDLMVYHMALREGRLLSPESWKEMRYKAPGLDNGLGYILGNSPNGRWEGNLGEMNGNFAAMMYLVEPNIYIVFMANKVPSVRAVGEFVAWILKRK